MCDNTPAPHHSSLISVYIFTLTTDLHPHYCRCSLSYPFQPCRGGTFHADLGFAPAVSFVAKIPSHGMTGLLSSIAQAVKPNGTASHANDKPSPTGSNPTSTPVEQLKQAVNGHAAHSERDRLLAQLSSEEKIALLSGDDMWHTVAVPRLDIPRVRVSRPARRVSWDADSGPDHSPCA